MPDHQINGGIRESLGLGNETLNWEKQAWIVTKEENEIDEIKAEKKEKE